MKIVIAPDSFKESLSAHQVATAIEQGIKQVIPSADIVKVPMADGGEGTVQAMIDATDGQMINLKVQGPMGKLVEAFYGIFTHANGQPTAVIEMAAASGLHHVPRDKRNPLLASSYGTGELIKDAVSRGIRHFIIGLGGSATNDAGAGMLQALGVNFLDNEGHALSPGGGALSALTQINTNNMLAELALCKFEVACDVDNPLCGERGASAVFGPQKGATPEVVNTLDNALAHFAKLTQTLFEHSQDKPINYADIKGAGAAGGMGFGILAYLNGELKPGVSLVADAVGLVDTIKNADLVITGEGRIDGQTVFGKTPMGVLNAAKLYHVDTIAIAGCLGDNPYAIKEYGMKAVFPIIPYLSDLETTLANANENLVNTAANIAALIFSSSMGLKDGNT